MNRSSASNPDTWLAESEKQSQMGGYNPPTVFIQDSIYPFEEKEDVIERKGNE